VRRSKRLSESLLRQVFSRSARGTAWPHSTMTGSTGDDVKTLKRARAAGHSISELIRKGLRLVASRFYGGRRPPTTRLFESTDNKLGEESELYKGLEG
jgi:hypothetical protein